MPDSCALKKYLLCWVKFLNNVSSEIDIASSLRPLNSPNLGPIEQQWTKTYRVL
jgi:hypothetical protein